MDNSDVLQRIGSRLSKSGFAMQSVPVDLRRESRALGYLLPVRVADSAGKAAARDHWWLKRVLDVAGSIILLLLLSPVLLAIAILIKVDSRGPIVFVQQRVGSRRRRRRNRTMWEIRTFPFYKFRSMYHNADQSAHEDYIRDFCEGRVEEPEAEFKLKNDPRVTRVGQFLRKTSLDELPQLVNVLKGEMSLVGPRPVPTYEVAHYKSSHFRRLAALPGITGLWQVRGRCQVPFEEMIRMDVDYVQRASVWLDLKILLLTLPAVVFGRGAG